MIRPPPSSTLFPYPPLFRSCLPATASSRRDGTTGGRHGSSAATGVHVSLTPSARTCRKAWTTLRPRRSIHPRSEEHTSELQSRQYLVCRLLLEKKKNLNTSH